MPRFSRGTAAQIEAMAQKAIVRRAPGTGGEVTLPLRITLTRAHWEALSAAAIRKGVNLETVIRELLEGEA